MHGGPGPEGRTSRREVHDRKHGAAPGESGHGENGESPRRILCHGKRRQFRNFAKTQGSLAAQNFQFPLEAECGSLCQVSVQSCVYM